MKKISVILVVALLLSAMAGCTESGDLTGTAKTTDTTNTTGTVGTGGVPSSSSENTGSNASSSSSTGTPVDPILPTTPENPGSSLVEYDPDREIYIFSAGHNYATWESYNGLPSFQMHIMSKIPLDLNTMELTIPVETVYTVSKREIPLQGFAEKGTEARDDQFSYELYQCYLGKDFAKLREMELAADALWDAANNKELTGEALTAAWDAYWAAEEAYEAYRDAEWAAYSNLTLEDIPKFCVYYVNVYFDDVEKDEVFTNVQLTVSGKVYDLDVGECRVCKRGTFPAELDWSRGDYTAVTHGIFGQGNAPLPYNDGIHRVNYYFSFEVKEYMCITDLVLDNPGQRLEKVWINLTTYDGLHYSGEWDLSEPLELYAGDRIIIDIAYRQEGLEGLSYYTNVWGFLVYECDDGTFCKLSQCNISLNINYYELYAIIFDGLNLESYYRDYYYPTYEPWRQEITN